MSVPVLLETVGGDEAVVEVLGVALEIIPEAHGPALRPQHGSPHPPEQLPHRHRRRPPRPAAALPVHPLLAANAPFHVQ